jgi:hypothetical protein
MENEEGTIRDVIDSADPDEVNQDLSGEEFGYSTIAAEGSSTEE